VRLRVIFTQDVPPRYRAGEVREVAGGYARNYLFPQGLAIPATAENLQRVEKIKRAGEERRRRLLEEVHALAQRIEGTVVTIRARAAEGGKLYGSVSAATIAQALSEAIGQPVERRWIALSEPIKALGSYPVKVHLYTGVAPTVTVVVEEEGRAPDRAPAPAAQGEGVQDVRGEAAPS
jgi:large subunit ribosomal protein L9